MFEALTSQTARTIVTALAAEPMPLSEVAETAGTSTQNARYHVENLLDVDLLTVVDTWYSQKGREMNIYGARYDTFVLTMDPSA